MEKQLRKLFILISIFILTSCSSKINFNDYIDKDLPLELKITKFNSNTLPEQFEISVNSDKFIKLTKWADNNTTGWHSTPASYISEIYVGQGNFRLLYTPGTAGVIIGFNDKDNVPRQYSKKTEKGELDFLAK